MANVKSILLKRLKLFAKGTGIFLYLFFIIYLIIINIKLHHQPIYQDNINQDAHYQLNYLKKEMHKDLPKRMNQLYPEGLIFAYSLYGLSWADLVQKLPSDHPTRQEALQEIDWCLTQMNLPKAKEQFHKDQPLSHGIFYNAWTTYLLGKRLALNQDSSLWATYEQSCQDIANAFAQAPSPFLSSYKNLAWPADNVVGMAALAQYNKISQTDRHAALIQAWVKQIEENYLDPQTNLIPHEVDYKNGKVLDREGGRGSSSSLMLCFLVEIDSAFAKSQYASYKKHLQIYRFGLPGIREHAIGGGADVDSGPVLLGVGGSASIVGLRAVALQEDAILATGLRNSIEGFGLGWKAGKEKSYLGGFVPMADLFIVWANLVDIQTQETEIKENWQFGFHWRSVLSFGLITFLIYWINKKLKIRNYSS
ncbi:MAG: hypothetical protein MK212_03115 [Saprospiraceae bacterium]|nr:hypothetical protein [Saprospiraceae bacterium]